MTDLKSEMEMICGKIDPELPEGIVDINGRISILDDLDSEVIKGISSDHWKDLGGWSFKVVGHSCRDGDWWYHVAGISTLIHSTWAICEKEYLKLKIEFLTMENEALKAQLELFAINSKKE